MELTAYLSILFVPLFLGLGVLGFLTWQIVKERRQEEKDPKRLPRFIFATLFWLAFIGFYIWRTWPEE